MSNVTIAGGSSNLPIASTINGANDYLPIYTASALATQAITRNTLLGLSSAPLGLTDTQSPTNKTFDNTSSYTTKDGSLTLQNTSDTTKQGNFSLSGLTTGTTRTWTLPNANVTLASLTGTETLTNKTLTSPTVNAPSITNATITADTYAGFTTSNSGTIYGISVTTGAINSSSAFGTGVILPSALLAGTGSSWSWQSWTPTFTNLAGGTLNYAKYIQIGKTVFWRMLYTMSGANVSGSVTFTIPVTAVTGIDSHSVMGSGYASVSSGTFNLINATLTSTTVATLFANTVSGSNVVGSVWSSSVPITWANLSSFAIQGVYEAA